MRLRSPQGGASHPRHNSTRGAPSQISGRPTKLPRRSPESISAARRSRCARGQQPGRAAHFLNPWLQACPLSRHRERQHDLIPNSPRPLDRVRRVMAGQPAPALEIAGQGRYRTPRGRMRQESRCAPPEPVGHLGRIDFRNRHSASFDEAATVVAQGVTQKQALTQVGPAAV